MVSCQPITFTLKSFFSLVYVVSFTTEKLEIFSADITFYDIYIYASLFLDLNWSTINLKAQGEKLEFNLKIQKVKQSETGSYLDLSPKRWSCLQESRNETVSESCLLQFYNPL